MSAKSKSKIFINGDAIDLYVPTKEYISDGWADWFNDPEVTNFLEQGRFPNLVEQEEEFFESIIRRERFRRCQQIEKAKESYAEVVTAVR